MVIGLEVHAQVASRRQALLRRLDPVRGRAQQPGQLRRRRRCRGCCPSSTRAASRRRCGPGWGSRRGSTSSRPSTARTTSTRTCRRATRSASSTTRSWARARCWSRWVRASARRVRIERIHVEQDAGKSIHDMDPAMSFVDLNRTGVALMEIVCRPDIRGPEEAAAYVAKLRQIMRYLGTCDGDMQHGNLRADVNVCVCRPGAYERYQETGDASGLGTRCEIKNMNSLRFIQAAIEYEARRQIAILEDGGKVDAGDAPLRPRPGRDPLDALQGGGARLPLLPRPRPPAAGDRAGLGGRHRGRRCPSCPTTKKARFVADFGMSDYDAGVLTAETEDAAFFEEVAHGPRRQAGGELGHQRALRAAQEGGPWHRATARSRPRSSARSST